MKKRRMVAALLVAAMFALSLASWNFNVEADGGWHHARHDCVDECVFDSFDFGWVGVDWSTVPHMTHVVRYEDFTTVAFIPVDTTGRKVGLSLPQNCYIAGEEMQPMLAPTCCLFPQVFSTVVSEIHSFNTMGSLAGRCIGVTRTISWVCFACGTHHGGQTQNLGGCGGTHS